MPAPPARGASSQQRPYFFLAFFLDAFFFAGI
jgi:hypothetical protein